MVETNPKGTAALLRCPGPRPFDRLKDLPRLLPKFVEPVETNPEVTSTFAPTPGPLTVRVLSYGIPLLLVNQRENFLSLLHYFGLLSMRCVGNDTPRRGIPNQTVRRLLYGHLRDAYDDVGVLSVDLLTFAGLLRRMTVNGQWQPVFEFLRDAIAEQTGVRDYLDGEKVIQGFLAAYLGVARHFVLRSKPELNKGFVDLCLEPLVARYPDLRHGYLIEIKYLKRSDAAGERDIRAGVRAATAQLQRYVADERLARRYPAVRFLGVVIVFHGWEMVYYDALPQ